MMTGDINAGTDEIKDGYRVISDVTVECFSFEIIHSKLCSSDKCRKY